MNTRLHRALLFAAYQLALSLGIVLFPLALLCQRAGLSVPFHAPSERIKDRLDRAD